MSSVLVQFTTDALEKLKSIEILDRLGLSLSDYLRLCLRRLNRENGIPFNMTLKNEEPNPALQALEKASRIAREYGVDNMSLDEINAEIAKTRETLA